MAAQTYIALLRGLNVGGNNRLAMKDLVAVFEAAGASQVSTYIQSGNVVFDASASVAAKVPGLVSAALEKRHQVRSPVVLRTAKELAAAVKNNPHLSAHDAAFLHVAFLADLPAVIALKAMDTAKFAPDVVAASGRELYLLLPNGVGRSKLTNAFFDSKLKTISTIRNWKTVVALRDLAESRS